MLMSHYALHAPFNSDPRFAPNYADSDKSKGAIAFATIVEGMDKSLGDLMDHLEALDVAEDTLIVFLGDNGSDAPLGKTHEVASSAPLLGKKATHYEGGMRVPFIAAWAKPDTSNFEQQRLPTLAAISQLDRAHHVPLGHEDSARLLLPARSGVEKVLPVMGSEVDPDHTVARVQDRRVGGGEA